MRRTFVLETRGDAVSDLAGFGPDLNQLDGVTNLSTKPIDPAHPRRPHDSGGKGAAVDVVASGNGVKASEADFWRLPRH